MLTTLLGGLADRKVFILYRVERLENGTLAKFPIDPYTKRFYPKDSGAAMNPEHWMTLEEVSNWSSIHGHGYGVGLVISTDIQIEGRRLFCLDIDHAREGEGWKPHVSAFLSMFQGAYAECSVSGAGVHIIGTYSGERPEHTVANDPFNSQLYTGLRFIALTGLSAFGDILADCTKALLPFAARYFPPKLAGDVDGELRASPVPAWNGPTDDAELIQRACSSNSASAVFAGRARFKDLWTRNMDVLPKVFPAKMPTKEYDGSGVDQALANHLAFWTGNHGERMVRLMRMSALVRSKWDERPTYLKDTILRACADQKEWYAPVTRHRAELPPGPPAPPSNDGPPPPPGPPAPPSDGPPPPPDAPLLSEENVSELFRQRFKPGSYIDGAEQKVAFHGLVYVQDVRGVYLPQSGSVLGREVFNDVYGGRLFATNVDGSKPTDNAWDAFVRSPLQDFPKVHGLRFEPRSLPGAMTTIDGLRYVNTWVPINIKKAPGDVTPFLYHLKKMLPNGNDAFLLLCYMAAVVQNPGVKAQWWPFIQGVEGNGKTRISKLLEYAVGSRYTHWPAAAQLDNHFNAAFYGKLLICVEDVFVPESKNTLFETLKPMITNTSLQITYKGVDSATREVCFNGMLNSNHKTGLRKTDNDRRIMPLFCAQQHSEHLLRDGMTPEYFNNLRKWIEGPGYAAVAHYLSMMEIPDEFNFARDCIRAPETTSTAEAIAAGLGTIEQEVVERILQAREGFRGGWVNSQALDGVLHEMGRAKYMNRDARKVMMSALGYEPHPSLAAGRALLPDGSQPILYIKRSTPALAAIARESVTGAYLSAQVSPVK